MISVDQYDKQLSIKFDLDDEIFLNPAKLLLKCTHLLTYSFQQHTTPVIKCAIIKAWVQWFYFFVYSNEITLAINLLEKLEIIEYTTYKTPNVDFYISNLLLNDNLIAYYLQSGMQVDTMIYKQFTTAPLRLCLAYKWLALKTIQSPNYLPILSIYAILSSDSEAKTVCDHLRLCDWEVDIKGMKTVKSAFETMLKSDLKIDDLYKQLKKN